MVNQANLNYRRQWDEFKRQLGPCACCGETEPLFLQVDHVNGGGTAIRSSVKGTNSYYGAIFRLYRANPSAIRSLCANCHLAISKTGACPHARLPD